MAEPVVVLAGVHPALVAPVVAQVPDDGGRPRRNLVLEGVGIGLVHAVALIARRHVVFVHRARAQLGDESFPDAGAAGHAQGMAGLVPGIELADDRDRVGVRRPHREVGAALAIDGGRVRAQFLVEPVVIALVEQVEIVVAQEREVIAHSVVLDERHGWSGARNLMPRTRRPRMRLIQTAWGSEPDALQFLFTFFRRRVLRVDWVAN